jgi:transcriptional regulator with XRE-family HTH domain
VASSGGGIHVVKLRRLRNELRRARESAELTQKQVADDLGWSISKVIRLETGAANIMTADVMALLHEYRITDRQQAERLLAITRQREQAWWWDEYQELYDHFPQFLNFLAYEDSATAIRQFQGLLVPGLLQSTDYLRAVISSFDEPKTAEQYIQVRLKRQELLRRNGGPALSFVLDEGVLHRTIGDRDVMAEQLRHIQALNAEPHIEIQVVPFSAGVVPGMAHSFALLELPEAIDGNTDYVVDVEDITGDTLPLLDRADDTSRYVKEFHRIRSIALSTTGTNKLIDSILATRQDGST